MGSEHLLPLVAAFAVVSCVYGSVGLGGGSAYIATMALLGMDNTRSTVVALALNLVVAGGGFAHFARSGYFRGKVFLPLVLTSIPAAFITAQIPMSRTAFQLLLGVALLCAGLRMAVAQWLVADEAEPRSEAPICLLAGLGIALGGLAGLTGIGGGIFLVPVLILGRLTTPKQTAAISAAFIVVNSVAGLAGRVATGVLMPWVLLVPLGVTVLIGGQLGALVGSRWLKPATVQATFGVVVLLVSLRLLVGSCATL